MNDLRTTPAPSLAFVGTADLMAELLRRTGQNLLLVWEDNGGLKYASPASILWAENAARYARRGMTQDIEAVRGNERQRDSD